MKKFLSMLLAVVTALCCVALCACNVSKLQKAVAEADSYTMALGYDADSHTLSAVQTVEISNRYDNSFTALKFHLYANQYREDAVNPVVPYTYKASAYPNGNSFGDVAFDSVKVNGAAVAYTIEGTDMDILSVPLAEEWFPDEKVTVEMVYQVQLANILHRLGYGANTVNLGNFYPSLCYVKNGEFVCSPYYSVGDPFVSEVANFDVTITLPQKFMVAASGNLAEATAGDSNSTYRYKADAIRDFALVLSDKYRKITTQTDGVDVNYCYFDDVDSDASLQIAAGALHMMNEKVGKYPYKQLTVCQTDFCYGGMEYGNLVMVTAGQQQYGEAIAHETIHQWFYGVVGNDQIENAWMDEGLTEFLTMLYMDKCGMRSLAESVAASTRTFTAYTDVLRNYFNHADTSFRAIPQYKNDSEYVCITYVKGSLLFYTLYSTMGENKFYRALSQYFDAAQFSVAAPETMYACFTKANGSDLRPVFLAFAEGKEVIGKVD